MTEKILHSKEKHTLKNSRAYKWFADGIANNLFSLLYGFNEYFIAGMTLPQVGRARATAAIGNMFTGGPYGEWHEYLSRTLNVKPLSHPLKKYGLDLLAFATGQSPIYAGYLIASTAGWDSIKALYEGNSEQLEEAWRNIDWSGIVKGTTFLTFVAPVAATPQRWVYYRVRRLFGLEKIITEVSKK